MNEYKNIQLYNSKLINYKEENINDKYFILSIKLCLEFLNLNKKNKLSYKQKEEDEYYLINKKCYEEIYSIFHFQEIEKELSESANSNDDILLEEIKNKLNATLEINKNIIEKKFNFESLFKLNVSIFNDIHELYYYKNTVLINEKIFILLKEITQNIIPKLKKIQCISDNNKFILFIDSNIINIGHLNEINEIEIDYLIHSEDKNKNAIILKEIFKEFKINGFKYFENYVSIHEISSVINHFIYKAKIYKLREKKISNMKYINTNQISEKLKSLILLSIFQIKNYNNNLNLGKTNEKIFLINNKLLINNYKYKEIKSLITKNNEIKEFIKGIDFSNFSYDSLTFNNIVLQLDPKILEEIDKYISSSNILTYSLKPNHENLILPKNKNIKIYKEFIMINELIFNIFKINFGLYSNDLDIVYNYKNGDILSIFEYPQNLILFGNIDSKNDFFNIQYILDYKEKEILKNELEKIKISGIENYINENAVFSKINQDNDHTSPIFSTTKIIGYCVKYNPNILNYDNHNIYESFLKSDIFLKVVNLSSYYNSIRNQMNENYYYNSDKKYYLIKKDYVLKIKNEINFESIKKMIDKNAFNENNNIISKSLLSSIKNIPLETLNQFINKSITKKKYIKEILEPNIISVNNINEPNSLNMIYETFEIFNEKAFSLFIENIFNIDNYLECCISEGKIIIHYPLNFNGNKKEISVIGSLDNENTFRKEYILIYEKSQRDEHMNKIKRNIIKYLDNLQLVNNTQPIIKNQYDIIGTLIKFENNKINNYKNNAKNMSINKNFNNSIKNFNNNNFINNGNNNSHNFNNNNNNINYDDMNNFDKYSVALSEYNLDYKVNSPFIKNNFPFPPLVGLENIGATCYMNATLQCFCHIEKFLNFFKYSKQIIDIVKKDRKKLSSSFRLLIEKLWPNNFVPNNRKNYYAPEEFKNKISKMNPLFKGVAANDAKDLVNFIIMTLHEELNKINKNSKINNNPFVDQRNQQLMFNNFARNFMAENKSIISDLFYGINCNITQCGGCNTCTFNYQTYFFIVFPLEEVRKYKFGNQFYNLNYNNNLVSIYDCFNFDQRITIMNGQNSMYCNYCKNTYNSSMRTILTTGPEILILLLNRGKGIEYNVKINFHSILDLTNYIEYKNTGCKYKLIGVITHMGESGMSGHLIAYCLDPISNGWHKYNDSTVTQVNDFQNEIINYARPYLLFYQKN